MFRCLLQVGGPVWITGIVALLEIRSFVWKLDWVRSFVMTCLVREGTSLVAVFANDLSGSRVPVVMLRGWNGSNETWMDSKR
jgi:hypothetical protein